MPLGLCTSNSEHELKGVPDRWRHTGECEVIDGKHAGLAVTIGARIASIAAPSEVLVSRTVKDLTAGSGFAFEDAGERDLKGVSDQWRVLPPSDLRARELAAAPALLSVLGSS